MSYGYMSGANQPNCRISVPKGQATGGNAIGILVLDVWYPYLPGNVANATTFEFPVQYKILKGIGREIFNADSKLFDAVIDGGKELQQQGVRAIVGACGYFATYQKEVAASLDIPVFLSSLLQIPIIGHGLRPDQKVGIICAVAPALTPNMLGQCGVGEMSDVVIIGAQDMPEFRNIIDCKGSFNSQKIEQELVELAIKLVGEHPEVGAILLECSDMPPYAWAIQSATRLPVFDFNTMINWIYNAVVRRPFAGFV